MRDNGLGRFIAITMIRDYLICLLTTNHCIGGHDRCAADDVIELLDRFESNPVRACWLVNVWATDSAPVSVSDRRAHARARS